MGRLNFLVNTNVFLSLPQIGADFAKGGGNVRYATGEIYEFLQVSQLLRFSLIPTD